MFYSHTVLDEATSAVSLQCEEDLYQTCRQLKITYVSVGHLTSLRDFHDQVLELDGEGGWLFSGTIQKEDLDDLEPAG